MNTMSMCSVLVSVLLLISGCTMRKLPTPLPEETRLQVRTIAVVPAAVDPERSFDASAVKGKGAGAAVGAGAGTLKGALSIVKLWPLYIFAPATYPIVIIGSAVAGAAEESKKAIPDDIVQKIDVLSAGAAARANLRQEFAEKVETSVKDLTNYRVIAGTNVTGVPEEKPDYRSLAGQDVDLVIETGVISLGFTGGKGPDPAIQFFVVAGVRVFKPGGPELTSGSSVYYSEPASASCWIQGGDARIAGEMDKAYALFAKKFVTKLFLTYASTLDKMSSQGEYCVLRPLAPATSLGYNPFKKRAIFPETDSLQPTFQWEAFPRDEDREYDTTGILGKVSDVTYDLRIWESRSDRPSELIYEKQGLSVGERVRTQEIRPMTGRQSPTGQWEEVPADHTIVREERFIEHAIDRQLDPSTNYYWSVRARYRIDDMARETAWARHRGALSFNEGPCDAGYNHMLFRFRTPAARPADRLPDIPSPSLAALTGAGAAEYKTPSDVVGKTFYTAVNIWSSDADKILSANYHKGEMIPLGTKVKITEVNDKNIVVMRPYIRFADDASQTYTIVFSLLHAKKGTTIWDVVRHYFSEKDPLGEGGAFHALTPEEQSHVKLGRIEQGMSKAAVVMAYGHPVGRETPSLEENRWVYLETPKARTIVYFSDDRVVRVSGR